MAVGIDSANLGDDSASTLEERAKKALECPCLDDLKYGPCGGEFSQAFLCFVKSQQPEKGSDCIEPFEKMQHCMTSNAKKFVSEQDSGTRVPSEEDEGDGEEGSVLSGLVTPPPEFRDNIIRLPPWYPKKDSKNQRSS